MHIEAIFPHPRTTVSAPEHKKYPYLLRGLTIDHPNQVWEMDITYNPKLKISMDGRGRATDDIYIERFWRSIKYENIYLNAYETSVDLYEGVNNYINFYNYSRPHKSIGYQTPECFYQKAS